jgi:hypothetical protein
MKVTVKARRRLEIITNLAVLLVCIIGIVALLRVAIIGRFFQSEILRQPGQGLGARPVISGKLGLTYSRAPSDCSCIEYYLSFLCGEPALLYTIGRSATQCSRSSDTLDIPEFATRSGHILERS